MKEGGEQVKLVVKIKYIRRASQAMLVLYLCQSYRGSSEIDRFALLSFYDQICS